MRLDSQEVQTMQTVVEKIVGDRSIIWGFGSRLIDSNRGGDWNLLIERDPAVDALTSANLKWSLALSGTVANQRL